MTRRLSSLVVALLVLIVGVLLATRTSVPRPDVEEAVVTVGDIHRTVLSTGTLRPTRTVTIGTQVSGTVRRVLVDTNSIVKKGQVLIEIDPTPSRDALDSAQAAHDAAALDLENDRDTSDQAARELARQEALLSRGLATVAERDVARVQEEIAATTVKEDESAMKVKDAAVTQAQLDLQHCVIVSPVDGVVLTRSVDTGQTVISRAQIDTLLEIATDLRHLQLVGDVDESDIGQVRPGQPVSLTVETYSTTFHGTVTSSRLNATNASNVVTFQTTADVDNPDLRLLPAMTATVRIETGDVRNAIRVPAVALRFRPTPAIFAALGQPTISSPRDAVLAVANTRARPAPLADATLIDHLFEPAPSPIQASHGWKLVDGRLDVVHLRTGATDGTWTELVSGDLKPGDALVTNVIVAPPRR